MYLIRYIEKKLDFFQQSRTAPLLAMVRFGMQMPAVLVLICGDPLRRKTALGM